MERLEKWIEDRDELSILHNGPAVGQIRRKVTVYKEEGQLEDQIAWSSDNGQILVFKNPTDDTDIDYSLCPEEAGKNGFLMGHDCIILAENFEEE